MQRKDVKIPGMLAEQIAYLLNLFRSRKEYQDVAGLVILMNVYRNSRGSDDKACPGLSRGV